MTKLFTTACGAALALALAVQPAFAKDKNKDAAPEGAAPAAAAPAGPSIVKGIGILNIEAAVVNTDAYRLAQQQQQVTYKPQIDSARQKGAALDAQIKAMAEKLQADANAKKPEAVLQQEYAQIQQVQENGKQEIQRTIQPLALSDAYVKEQISDQLDAAVQSAMAKKGVSLLLHPDAVIARAGTYEMTGDVVAELNQLIPAAKMQLVPPPGWMPREQREQMARQQAAMQAQQGAAPAAAAPAPAAPRPAQPAGPQPDGR